MENNRIIASQLIGSTKLVSKMPQNSELIMAYRKTKQNFYRLKALTCLLFVLIVSTGFSQTNCKPYVPVSKGTTWEITNYSPKGKETGKVAYELVDKIETGDDVTFTIKAISYDKKGKETYSNQYEAHCVNGKFQFDMAFKIDGATMQSYQNMDVDIDASEFEVPSMDVSPGTKLNDGTLTVKIGGNSVSMLQMTIHITDRNVEAIEQIETPAGAFKCLKLSQKINTKMIVKLESTSKEWYAEEIGIVRSETYNKNGKLTGYSELTKLNK